MKRSILMLRGTQQTVTVGYLAFLSSMHEELFKEQLPCTLRGSRQWRGTSRSRGNVCVRNSSVAQRDACRRLAQRQVQQSSIGYCSDCIHHHQYGSSGCALARADEEGQQSWTHSRP